MSFSTQRFGYFASCFVQGWRVGSYSGKNVNSDFTKRKCLGKYWVVWKITEQVRLYYVTSSHVKFIQIVISIKMSFLVQNSTSHKVIRHYIKCAVSLPISEVWTVTMLVWALYMCLSVRMKCGQQVNSVLLLRFVVCCGNYGFLFQILVEILYTRNACYFALYRSEYQNWQCPFLCAIFTLSDWQSALWFLTSSVDTLCFV
jgi:hypothetical protein